MTIKYSMMYQYNVGDKSRLMHLLMVTIVMVLVYQVSYFVKFGTELALLDQCENVDLKGYAIWCFWKFTGKWPRFRALDKGPAGKYYMLVYAGSKSTVVTVFLPMEYLVESTLILIIVLH